MKMKLIHIELTLHNLIIYFILIIINFKMYFISLTLTYFIKINKSDHYVIVYNVI